MQQHSEHVYSMRHKSSQVLYFILISYLFYIYKLVEAQIYLIFLNTYCLL